MYPPHAFSQCVLTKPLHASLCAFLHSLATSQKHITQWPLGCEHSIWTKPQSPGFDQYRTLNDDAITNYFCIKISDNKCFKTLENPPHLFSGMGTLHYMDKNIVYNLCFFYCCLTWTLQYTHYKLYRCWTEI